MRANDHNVAAVKEMFFVFLATRQEHDDPKTCRKSLLGPMRRQLKDITGTDAVAIMTAAPGLIGRVLARGEAREDLATFCLRCGRCRLSREEP